MIEPGEVFCNFEYRVYFWTTDNCGTSGPQFFGVLAISLVSRAELLHDVKLVTGLYMWS